jgi:hypothetical protein
VVFSDALGNLSSVTINGLQGDDILVVSYTNGFFATPTVFNGGFHSTPTGDGLKVEGPIPGAASSSYSAGSESAEGKSGTITNSTGLLNHVIQFSGLEPITITGPFALLTVIAGLSGGTALTLSDDPADTAGTGGNVLTSNGTMETL